MSLPAARARDISGCPAHGAGEVCQGAHTVQANNQPLARATDECLCAGGLPNALTTGSATVLANGLPVAHLGSRTRHGGAVLLGSPNVWVGGPDTTLVGPIGAGTQSCKAMAQTRHTKGQRGQSYGNCALETMRGMLNAHREQQGLPPITEDEMLRKGIAAGAKNDPAKPWAIGAADGETQSKVMEAEGLPIAWQSGTSENIETALAKGQPIGAGVRPVEYWPPGSVDRDAEHEVLVIGVRYDDKGKIDAYIINDTGIGQCGMIVPAAAFDAARKTATGEQKPIMVPEERVY